MSDKIKVYEPDNSIKKGYFFTIVEIFRELKNNRWLTYQFFKRDLFAVYKQSFFSFFWALIIPIISVGTFIILNKSGIFTFGDIDVPYPIYAIMGMSIWQLFATGLISSSSSLVKAGPMIAKINFSKKSLVLASIGQALISFLIQFILVCILYGYYKITPKITILLMPIAAIPIALLTIGLGFILALLNGVFRDISNVIASLITFLMFLTPVLYKKPETGILGIISKYNPLYYLVNGPRELLLTGEILEWQGFLISGVISLIIFMVCIIIFHLTETRIIERV